LISFDGFIMEDGVPIYQQILLYLKRGIIAGTIVNGDELPSRRVLSALLGVNPNTVQKAYRLLEEEGMIRSQSGAKSSVVLDEKSIARLRRELLEGDAKAIVSTLRQMGLNRQEAINLIETYWNEV
jgi:GntR family transcriptional regulator